MDVNDAYERLCQYMEERVAVVSCRSYKDHYGFYCAPPGTDLQHSSGVFVGRSMVLVNKNTGEVCLQHDRDAPDLYRQRWRPVSTSKLSDVLVHHGIPHQQWHVSNGPPYPLSDEVHDAVVKGNKVTQAMKKAGKGIKSAVNAVQKAREKHKEKKMNKLIKKGSYNKIVKNLDKMSDTQLEAAKKRLELKRSVRDVAEKEKEKAKGFTDKALEFAEKAKSLETAYADVLKGVQAGAKQIRDIKNEGLKNKAEAANLKTALAEAESKLANSELQSKASKAELEAKVKAAEDKIANADRDKKLADLKAANSLVAEKAREQVGKVAGKLLDDLASKGYTPSAATAQGQADEVAKWVGTINNIANLISGKPASGGNNALKQPNNNGNANLNDDEKKKKVVITGFGQGK